MPAVSMTQLDARSERTLLWLMFARLSLSLLSFAIAIGLAGLTGDLAPEAERGLNWSVTLAFLATVLTGVLLPRVRRPRRFAAVQIVTDVAICTSLVYFSGGRESVFTFLYVVVTLYGAILFERAGGLAGAAFSGLAYGAVLVGVNEGWLIDFANTPGPVPLPVLAASWGVLAAALLLVGVLASALSRELLRTGAALSRSTHDLKLLKDLHQRTVESLMSGLVTTDCEGRITSANPEAERLLGMRSREVWERHVDEVIPGAGDLVLTGTDAERPQRARLPFRNAAGEELHLGLAGSVLRESDGSELGHVVIFQDVTNVAAMERELRRSERMAAVGEMAAKMAHEIRNPLAAISGSIQILRGDLTADPANPEPTRLMEIVVRETDRLNALLRDFLLFARPAPPSLGAVDAAKLVEDVLRLIEPTRPEAVRVEHRRRSPVAVRADAAQLRQVVWNLCLNAIQGMPEGGSVVVETGAAPGSPQEGQPASRNEAGEGAVHDSPRWGEIAVSDTGPGIPPELQEQIFEPFFTTKKDGSGLGLATVHRVVESHGGSLELDSHPDRGTTFRIRLPGVRGEA